MKASIQILIQGFKAIVFEKDELDFQDMSYLNELLPLLAYEETKYDVEIISEICGNEQFASGMKLLRLTP